MNDGSLVDRWVSRSPVPLSETERIGESPTEPLVSALLNKRHSILKKAEMAGLKPKWPKQIQKERLAVGGAKKYKRIAGCP